MHVCEIHVYEMPVYNMHVHEMHTYEKYTLRDVRLLDAHACETYAYELRAYEMHDSDMHEFVAVRCLFRFSPPDQALRLSRRFATLKVPFPPRPPPSLHSTLYFICHRSVNAMLWSSAEPNSAYSGNPYQEISSQISSAFPDEFLT